MIGGSTGLSYPAHSFVAHLEQVYPLCAACDAHIGELQTNTRPLTDRDLTVN